MSHPAAPAAPAAAPDPPSPGCAGESLPRRADVVVVGSGFAGIAAAVSLLRAGHADLLILERGTDVGGTWRDNSYPGCACDVPSHLYSFSFAPNPDWSRSFSPQPEIHAYLRRVTREQGLEPLLRFGCELLEARWRDSERRWALRTTRGEITCRYLVLGTGALSEPSVPHLPGLETFTGTTFHTASWRHDHVLAGRRVGVLGTGASAIQVVPEVAGQAAHLTVFQRTAPWVLPRRDRAITAAERWVYRRWPAVQRLVRGGIYAGRETWIVGFALRPALMRLGERQALRFLARQVPDPELRRRLTPSFRLGCKRVLLSSTYYPVLAGSTVAVVTGRIVEVVGDGVVTEDPAGQRHHHALDTLVFATGFHVTDPPIAARVCDADGRSLASHWAADGMSALHGLTVAGFPNLFFLVGPNTGLGHTSIVVMIEAQTRYLAELLTRVAAGGATGVEPRPEVQQAYNAGLQRALARTVWNTGGCASWYLDHHGRNTTLWPTFTFSYRRELARVDLSQYRLHR